MEPNESIPRIDVRRLTGAESFHRGGEPLDLDVLRFWSWSASDLASNNLRGHLAEFLVATALDEGDGVRVEWDAHDVRLASGHTVEVKSSAYIQSWEQKSGPTKICFDIAPRTSWDSVTNEYLTTVKRHSAVYVFCAEVCTDPASFDPLDLNQWRFFVLPTSTLDDTLGNQKKLALGRLAEVGAVAYSTRSRTPIPRHAGQHSTPSRTAFRTMPDTVPADAGHFRQPAWNRIVRA